MGFSFPQAWEIQYTGNHGRFHRPTAALIHSLVVSFSWFTKYALVDNRPDSIYVWLQYPCYRRTLSDLLQERGVSSGVRLTARLSPPLLQSTVWRLLCCLRASAWLCCGVVMGQTLVSSRMFQRKKKRKRRLEISTPRNFEHRVHTSFDPMQGCFVGLPPQWQSLIDTLRRPKPVVDPSSVTQVQLKPQKVTLLQYPNMTRCERVCVSGACTGSVMYFLNACSHALV